METAKLQNRFRVQLKGCYDNRHRKAVDQTGDRKKGKTTDYVDRQYIGNLGKVENGIVSVNADGVLEQLTFPLSFKSFKPKARLKPIQSTQDHFEQIGHLYRLRP